MGCAWPALGAKAGAAATSAEVPGGARQALARLAPGDKARRDTQQHADRERLTGFQAPNRLVHWRCAATVRRARPAAGMRRPGGIRTRLTAGPMLRCTADVRFQPSRAAILDNKRAPIQKIDTVDGQSGLASQSVHANTGSPAAKQALQPPDVRAPQPDQNL